MKTSAKKSAILILVFMLGVLVSGRFAKLWQLASLQAETLTQKVVTIEKENLILTVQAKETKSVTLTDDQVKKILEILMPQKADRSRFLAILACENSSHDPKRVNVNKPGLGYDLGVAQINSKFHSNRVKEFFGQDFDEAMQDPVRNLLYATYLYQQSGNFHLWACDRQVLK